MNFFEPLICFYLIFRFNIRTVFCTLTWSFPSCGKQRRIPEASFSMWVSSIRKSMNHFSWRALNKANVMFLKIPVSLSVVVYNAQIYIWLLFVFILLRIKSTAFCYDSENVDQLLISGDEKLSEVYIHEVCFVLYITWISLFIFDLYLLKIIVSYIYGCLWYDKPIVLQN